MFSYIYMWKAEPFLNILSAGERDFTMQSYSAATRDWYLCWRALRCSSPFRRVRGYTISRRVCIYMTLNSHRWLRTDICGWLLRGCDLVQQGMA